MILVADTLDIEHNDLVYTLHGVEYSPGLVSRDPWQPDDPADLSVARVEVQDGEGTEPRRVTWHEVPDEVRDRAWARAEWLFDNADEGGDT